jgi:UDPglucose--hexose-1-phosphate uridylyltransferase
MADFSFLQNKTTGKWVVFAPRRAKRTNVAGKKKEGVCPFCIGREHDEPELYRVGGTHGDSNWQIRVIPNKFPFTPHHELIIHSPDHHKNIDELPFSQVELLIQTYQVRYRILQKHGQVYIFHNHGFEGGESQHHPHTQVTVIPKSMTLNIPPLDTDFLYKEPFQLIHRPKTPKNILETDHFLLFCPETSNWPDEVWLAPKHPNTTFGQLTAHQITDLAFVLSRLIQIFDTRHGSEFPFNFYIYPGSNWYLRLIPRLKTLGGFELGTQIIVNTQDPKETFAFIREHFWEPDHEKIRSDHTADYWRGV